MPLKRAVTEFGKTYKDRFALRTYPGTSVPIFIFILGWSRTKPRVTLSAQTVRRGRAAAVNINKARAQPGNEAENGRYGAVKGRYRAIICPIRQGLLPGDAGR